MENGERRESELPEAAIGGQLGETFPVSFKMEFGQGKGEEEKGRGQTVPISAKRSVFFQDGNDTWTNNEQQRGKKK